MYTCYIAHTACSHYEYIGNVNCKKVAMKGNGMSRVVVSKSNDTAANNSHHRTVSSLNLVRSAKSRTAKSRVAKSRTAKSLSSKPRSAQSDSTKSRVTEKSNAKSRNIASRIFKSHTTNTHIAQPRSAASLRKSQRAHSQMMSQRTTQMRIVHNHHEQHQDKFVDARSLPGLDFVKKTLSQKTGSFGMMTRPHIVDFRERLKERKSAYLHFTFRRLIAILLVIVTISIMAWLLFFSPLFRLTADDISVAGSNEWVSEEKIASIASTQVNKSLFLVSSQEVINQLNDIPGVTEAKVVKDFPHSLHVTVHAQRPAAMLKTSDNTMLTAVDAKGRVLNSVAHASTQGIPVIEVVDVQRSLNNCAVLEAVKIVSSLPESLRSRITKVSAKTQDSVETELGGVKRTIVWGNASQLELKKAIVAKIIDDSSKIGNKQRLDVSAPVRPILK